jgi:AAA15 family ATPase/GTPase
MLIRLIIDNILSFGEEREFNMLPMPRLRTLKEHKYNIDGFNILKMTSIYGANGAGKSNLVKSMLILQELIVDEIPLINFSKNRRFKFSNKDQPQTFIIEFFQNEKAFLYGLEVLNNVVTTEELYLSGLGKKDNKLLFERITDEESKKITFKSPLLKDEEGKILTNIIENNLAKPNKTIFKLLTTLNKTELQDIKTALNWFKDSLVIVTPDAKPAALVHKIDTNNKFKIFTEDLMKSFHIGISNIKVEKKTLEEFFGENDLNKLDKIIEELDSSKNKMIGLQINGSQEVIITKEDNDNIYVKKLQVSHKGKNDIEVMFDLDEESDGTIRLLDFAPAFQDVAINKKVYVIDEIERSIHPLLIKELVRKFSKDNQSNGQLIFTTHESNLLDQSIFRQDEIWFAEKDKNGSTDLYSLSDYKEHNTIDIRKGYLMGRYGSIPFLGNLKDLNWHDYEIEN